MAPAPKVEIAGKSVQEYVDGAWELMDRGLFVKALSELDLAVEAEPTFADAWFARGWALEKAGRPEDAIADYGHAIDVKPDHAFALFSRAYLKLYAGRPQDAVTDFLRTQGVAEDAALRQYAHLWLHLSRARAGQDATARLTEDVKDEALDRWPGPLIAHLLGRLDADGVRAVIEKSDDVQIGAPRDERRCTGYFFLGAEALRAGDAPLARSHFEKALASGAVAFRQYDAAKRELERLAR
ncbi:MAG: tetratricopeptide repeat protein [Alphaproteobacteria bacterium]|nr:tetratricopeptide repeat protein [Alphaproteobacteria bacterium]